MKQPWINDLTMNLARALVDAILSPPYTLPRYKRHWGQCAILADALEEAGCPTTNQMLRQLRQQEDPSGLLQHLQCLMDGEEWPVSYLAYDEIDIAFKVLQEKFLKRAGLL